MKLLRRSQPPLFDDHLSYFTLAEANEFRRIVERSFAGAGRDVSVHSDRVEDRTGTTLSLWNIGMLCAGAERQDWPDLIAEHVQLVTTPPQGLADLTQDEVERGLYLRLVETASVADPDALGHARVVAPGLLEVLSVDLPDFVATPSRDELAAYGSLGELVARGRDNLLALLAGDDPGSETVDEGSEGTYTAVSGASYFTASLALVLAETVRRYSGQDDWGPGALVAVPGRHRLLYRLVDAGDAGLALRRMFEVARRDHLRAPGPLSPNVFWVRNRRWVPVTSYEAGKPRVVLGELRGVLKSL